MPIGRAILIALLAVPLAGCLDTRARALKSVKRATEHQLRKDAAKYYKNIFAARRMSPTTVSSNYWSGAFKELNPQRITAYPDGFAFCLERNGDDESGLYIIPLGMEHEPKPTPWASFEKLSEGIFWYSFKP